MEPKQRQRYTVTLLVEDAERLILIGGTLSAGITTLARKKDAVMSARALTPKPAKQVEEKKVKPLTEAQRSLMGNIINTRRRLAYDLEPSQRRQIVADIKEMESAADDVVRTSLAKYYKLNPAELEHG